MRTLNDLYTRLDRVIMTEMPSLYKVETIGDAYLVAANLFEPDPQHAATMARFALRARQEAAKVPRPDTDDGSTLQMRMGEGLGFGGVHWKQGEGAYILVLQVRRVDAGLCMLRVIEVVIGVMGRC